MTWTVLNGIYPGNPLWQMQVLIVTIFEALVIVLEITIILQNWEWVRKNKKHAACALVIANLITFGIGTLIQLLFI